MGAMPPDPLPVPRPGPLAAIVEIIRWRRILAAGVPRSPPETRAAGILRPVVFGGNDGLVSNLALVMGVAGAAPAPGDVVRLAPIPAKGLLTAVRRIVGA